MMILGAPPLNRALCPSAAASPCKPLHSRSALSRHCSLPLSSPSIPRINAQKLKISCGFSVTASKRGTKSSDAVDDSDDEVMMPLKEMNRWFENKPSGFGEGKKYDTAVEEKLLQEIEQSRKSQLANIKKLKSPTPPKKQEAQQKVIDVVPSGTRVGISNLPKKKNIHKDLQSAFKGFHGIVNISPAVVGNHKTKDPICKGFAFVDLESKEAADRFVLNYSKQQVLFGKAQKQITCHVINPCHSSEPGEQLAGDSKATLHPKSIRITLDDQSHKESALLVTKREGLSSNCDELETNIAHLDCFPSYNAENEGEANVDGFDSNCSPTLLQKQKKQVDSKKKKLRTKSTKNSKLTMPGSLARLRVKERDLLTGVFSKYGGKVASDLRNNC